MNIHYTIALLVFLMVVVILIIRYVNLTVDKEFRNLARAVSDKEYRDGELARAGSFLADFLPLPPETTPVSAPGGKKALPPILMAVGAFLLWCGAVLPESGSVWLYSGAAAMLAAAIVMLATLRSRKWERVARLLRFRADLRRIDDDHAGAAADLRELVRLTPLDDAAWAELSDDLAAVGQFEDALDSVRQASRLDPRYEEYRMIETSLCIRMGRLEKAREALNAWAELPGMGPDDPRVVIYRAALDLAEGRHDRAADSIRNILRENDGQSLVFLDSDKALAEVRALLPHVE